MSDCKVFSIKELSDITGVAPRTIRAYIADGLIRGPESRGRHASYTEFHLKRLKTIQLLKDHYGLPLSEVRRYLLMAREDEEIRVVPIGASTHIDNSDAGFDDLDAESAPAEKMPWLHNDEDPSSCSSAIESIRPGEGPAVARVTHLIRKALSGRRVSRSARAQAVHEIDITPDLALRIRGDFSRDEVALFEQLADALREGLLGGLQDD